MAPVIIGVFRWLRGDPINAAKDSEAPLNQASAIWVMGYVSAFELAFLLTQMET